MLTPLAPGSSVTPIISVGDTVRGYKFEAIPDGISFTRNGQGTMDVYVNHETSLVPFPANRSDFTNSLVSKLRLNQHSAGVLRGEYVIGNDANYQRFCSNFLVGPAQGFERELLLTNEEARDIVLREGYAWHPPFVSLDEPSAEQAGVVVALDIKSGAHRSIYGMGRHNHENDVGVPGYGHPVVLSGDDTFDAPASQLYLYSAASGQALWNDEGALYAFIADDPNVNDYGDFPAANGASGHFIPVPPMIATARSPTGRTCGQPTSGTRLRRPASRTGRSGCSSTGATTSCGRSSSSGSRTSPTTGPRRTSSTSPTRGEPRAIPDGAGRLRRGASGTRGLYPNGRIFKMVLDPERPAHGAEPVDAHRPRSAGLRQPRGHAPAGQRRDDREQPLRPGGSRAATTRAPSTATRRSGATRCREAHSSRSRRSNQSQRPDLPIGSWESSGIIDASSAFGPGAFLLDVQAHGWEIDVAPSPYPGIDLKREAGQLMLLRVPGS